VISYRRTLPVLPCCCSYYVLVPRPKQTKEEHANDNTNDDDEVKTDPEAEVAETCREGATPTQQQQQQQQQHHQQVPTPMGMHGMVPSPHGLGPGGMGYGYQPPPGSMRPGPGGGGAFPFPPHHQGMMPYPGGGVGGGFPPMMYPPAPYAAAAGAYPNPGMMMPSAMGPLPKKLENSSPSTQLQICTIHPPGMPRAFDVPFPPRKLPVCLRCKKNYRSRELCRQRDEHKSLPWQTTYIIVTLTESVLEKREDGSQYITDMPVVATLQEMPDLCRGPADGFMSKQPICKMCKEKNYTREYCRTTSKHTTPPYQTVYIKLVPRTVEDDHIMNLRLSKKKKRKAEEHCDGKPTSNHGGVKVEEEGTEADAHEDEVVNEEDKSDDLSQIHPSKTFFAEVSAKKITVKVCGEILFAFPVLVEYEMYISLMLSHSSPSLVIRLRRPTFLSLSLSGANKSNTPMWSSTIPTWGSCPHLRQAATTT
jgi:hypothetical protein